MAKHGGNQGGRHSALGERLLQLLEQTGPMTVAQVYPLLDASSGAIDQSLRLLQQKGLLQRIGNTRPPVWGLAARQDGSALEEAWPMRMILPRGRARIVRGVMG